MHGVHETSRRLCALTLATVALALGACATTDPYATFTSSGAAYVSQLDAALLAAHHAAIDASSWRLLDDDALSNTEPSTYATATERDRSRGLLIARLRAHSAGLARYFEVLAGFTASTVPPESAAALGRSWSAVAKLGAVLRADAAFPPPQMITEPMKSVLAQVIKGAMRKELTVRADAIRTELATQEVLLGALEASIAHDLALSTDIAERLVVLDPLTAEGPVPDPERWVASRQRLLTAAESVQALAAAKASAASLRAAFDGIVVPEAK